MTAKQKERLRERATTDPNLTAGAALLLLRLLLIADELGDEFPMSHKNAGRIVGKTDKATIYARINQLVPGYLTRARLDGCPPTWKFKFNV
jgi:hypothetical protein